MVIDDPATLAEVEAAFAAYEAALVGNDVPALDAVFWNDGRAIRYGGGENLYGHAAIAAFRAAPGLRAGPNAGPHRGDHVWS